MSGIVPLLHVGGFPKYVSIPLFTGIIGWVTNLTGVWMLFYPLQFKGIRIPGLKLLAPFLPRKLQQVPLGLMRGKFGWQGIIPSRSAKMGSIAVDRGLSKLGSQSEFYQQLDPNAIAEHILRVSGDEIHQLVDDIMHRWYPGLWSGLPAQVKDAVHARVQNQLPAIVHKVTDGIGANIDQLFDVKLMVIRYMADDPRLANKIFQEVGRRELRLIVHFGFLFGFLLGIPLVFLTIALPLWWVVPIAGILIGWVTNWLAIVVIFEPVNPVKIGPLRIQGLFIRRQPEVAKTYAGIIADDIITLRNVGTELFDGASGDRTRHLIAAELRPAVDDAVGAAKLPIRVAIGGKTYDDIAQSMVVEATGYTSASLRDDEFNRQQGANIRRLIGERMAAMAPRDFSETLRSAIKEDEWLLILHGAVLGLAAGLLHVLIFGA